MYFLFMHNQGGRLYIHTNTGQVLCVLFWLPNGLTPSVLVPSTMFLGSFKKFWVFEVQRFPLARILRVTQHLVFLFISGSFLPSSRFFSSLSACQRRSFATLGSAKYRYRRGVIGKYHTTFRGAFFLFLYRVTPHTGHMVDSACSSR